MKRGARAKAWEERQQGKNQRKQTEEMINYGNISLQVDKEQEKSDERTPAEPEPQEEEDEQMLFPNGKSKMEFDEFIDLIKESCEDKDVAENYLVHAFSMFDWKSKW